MIRNHYGRRTAANKMSGYSDMDPGRCIEWLTAMKAKRHIIRGDVSEFVSKLGVEGRKHYCEVLSGDKFTKFYFDFDHKEDRPLGEQELTRYFVRIEEDIRRLMEVIAPGIEVKVAWAQRHGMKEGKFKVSYRAFVSGVKVLYHHIPALVRSAREKLLPYLISENWDMAVYKKKEQLLGAVECTKDITDGRVLRRMHGASIEDTLVQVVGDDWPEVNASEDALQTESRVARLKRETGEKEELEGKARDFVINKVKSILGTKYGDVTSQCTHVEGVVPQDAQFYFQTSGKRECCYGEEHDSNNFYIKIKENRLSYLCLAFGCLEKGELKVMAGHVFSEEELERLEKLKGIDQIQKERRLMKEEKERKRKWAEEEKERKRKKAEEEKEVARSTSERLRQECANHEGDMSMDRTYIAEWGKSLEDSEPEDMENVEESQVWNTSVADMVRYMNRYLMIDIDSGYKSVILCSYPSKYDMERQSIEVIHFARTYMAEAKEAWTIWLQHQDRREVRTVFEPGEDIDLANVKKLNLYTPPLAKQKLMEEPDFEMDREMVDRTLRHIYTALCGEDKEVYNYFMSWLASIVQNPAKKTEVAVVFIGDQGVGKGLFIDRFIGNKVFGTHLYTQVQDVEQIVGKFNPMVANKILVNADECNSFGGGHKQANRLKNVVTEDRIQFEEKYKNALNIKSYHNYIFTTNSYFPVKIEPHDRRYLVVQTSSKYRGDRDYFRLLAEEMEHPDAPAHFYKYLEKWNLDGFEIKDIPMTELKRELAKRELPEAAIFLYERMQSRTFPFGIYEAKGVRQENGITQYLTTDNVKPVRCDEVYAEFVKHCEDNHAQKMEKRTFGVWMSTRLGIKSKGKRVAGTYHKCYVLEEKEVKSKMVAAGVWPESDDDVM